MSRLGDLKDNSVFQEWLEVQLNVFKGARETAGTQRLSLNRWREWRRTRHLDTEKSLLEEHNRTTLQLKMK